MKNNGFRATQGFANREKNRIGIIISSVIKKTVL